jgi:hypothetical protein
MLKRDKQLKLNGLAIGNVDNYTPKNCFSVYIDIFLLLVRVLLHLNRFCK